MVFLINFFTAEGLLINFLVLVRLRVNVVAGEFDGVAGEDGAEDAGEWMVWLRMEFAAWGCGLRKVRGLLEEVFGLKLEF